MCCRWVVCCKLAGECARRTGSLLVRWPFYGFAFETAGTRAVVGVGGKLERNVSISRFNVVDVRELDETWESSEPALQRIIRS